MKYVLGVFGFIILTIVAVVLLASVTSTRTETQTGKKVVTMADHIDQGKVTFTTQGEIVGDESYQEIRVIVSPSERRVQILRGYNERVEREQVLGNTKEAFDAFMRSLGNAGYSRERTTKLTDVRGVCPTGLRYLYRLQDGDKEIVNTWNTSCNSRDGTFGGDSSTVRNLFQAQIPAYDDFVGEDQL